MSPLSPFESLPLEVTQQVLIACTPSDMGSVARLCKHFHSIIHSPSDAFIWRELFLSIFDDPRIRMASDRLGHTATPSQIKQVAEGIQFDWMERLQERIGAMNLIRTERKAINTTSQERLRALQAFISVVETSPPFMGTEQANTSKSLDWLHDLLERAGALNHRTWPPLQHPLFPAGQYPTQEELDVRSKLHTYLGLTQQDKSTPVESLGTPFVNRSTGHLSVRDRPRSLRSLARLRAYDHQSYVMETMWGPFRTSVGPAIDGTSPRRWTANWSHVEALMVVMAFNAEETKSVRLELMDGPEFVPPMGLEALRPYSAPGSHSVQPPDSNAIGGFSISGPSDPIYCSVKGPRYPGDWAGVEGHWRRIGCVLEYSPYRSFNLNSLRAEITARWDDDDTEEATRRSTLRLQIMDIESPGSSSTPNPVALDQNGNFGERPRIHFVGTGNRGGADPLTLKGFVESDPETGEIRWRMVSRYSLGQIWATEGIQVGGVGSKMGVIGCWTTVDHDELGDPAGPSWTWKVGDL